MARIHLDSDLLMPGGHCSAYLALNKKIPVESSRPFTLRDHSTHQTIAHGIIREILPALDTTTKLGLKILDEAVENI